MVGNNRFEHNLSDRNIPFFDDFRRNCRDFYTSKKEFQRGNREGINTEFTARVQKSLIFELLG